MFGGVLGTPPKWTSCISLGDLFHNTSSSHINMEAFLFIPISPDQYILFGLQNSHSCKSGSKYLRPSLFENYFLLSKVVELPVEIMNSCIQHFQNLYWCQTFSKKSFSNISSKALLNEKSVLIAFFNLFWVNVPFLYLLETKDFLAFSGGIEMEHRLKMG